MFPGRHDHGRSFHLIVPQPEKAGRAYKDINLMAFRLLARGGALTTHFCSSAGFNASLIQKIIAGEALDAGVEARIECWLQCDRPTPAGLELPRR
jgi:23S rRNA (cytosine1962-C5)-methyltransferase